MPWLADKNACRVSRTRRVHAGMCEQGAVKMTPPVMGVHQERVLSSKNRILAMMSTLYHSAKTIRPRPC